MIRQYSEHSDFEKAQWGSHKEIIIDHLIDKNQIETNSMLELGAGEFSTPVYAPLFKKFYSVETDKDWYEFIKTKYPFSNTEYHHLSDMQIQEFIDKLFEKDIPDCVLVDHTHTIPNHRSMIANYLIKKGCKHIVIHDLCDDMYTTLEVNPAYEYLVNKKSINPSLLISRK